MNGEWTADSLVLAEFHEQRGPVAVWADPACGTVLPDGTATLTQAALAPLLSNVLSVDYRSALSALAAFQANTVVLAEAPTDGYAHLAVHFTLLDVAARGFVRPFALVYITRDSDRLAAHQQALAAQLGGAVDLLQRANRVAVLVDVRQRAASIRHTQQLLQSGDEQAIAQAFAETGGRPQYVPAALGEVLCELAELEHRLLDLAVPERGQERVPEQYCVPLDDLLAEHAQTPPHTPAVVLAIHKNSFDKALKEVDALCGHATTASVRKYLHDVVLAQHACPFALEALRENEAPVYALRRDLLLVVGGAVTVNFALDVSRRAPTRRNVLSAAGEAAVWSQPAGVLCARGTPADGTRNIDSFYEQEWRQRVCQFLDNLPMSASTTTSATKQSEEEVEDSKEDEDALEEKQQKTLSIEEEAPRNLWYCGVSEKHKQEAIEQQQQQQQVGAEPPIVKVEEVTYGQLLRECVFAEHLVYSLLTGRPVAVYGPDASSVRTVVRLLSIFVAGDPSTTVCAERSEPLSLGDLTTLRLVGLATARAARTPKHVAQCLTQLTVSEGGVPRSLVAPPYPVGREDKLAGSRKVPAGVVHRLLARNSQWVDDATYAAHLHEELHALATTAFVYYHMCCAGLAMPVPFREAGLWPFAACSAAETELLKAPSLAITHTRSTSNSNSTSSSKDTHKRRIRTPSKSEAKIDLSTSPPDSITPADQHLRAEQQQKQQQQQQQQKQQVKQPLCVCEHLELAIQSAEATVEPAYPTQPVTSTARQTATRAFFARYRVEPGDQEIVQYLAEVVKQQQVPACYPAPVRMSTDTCKEYSAAG